MNPTPVTPEEARRALEAADATARQMRRMLAHGGLPYFLWIWGTVWLLGFGATHFFGPHDPRTAWAWAILDTAGAVLSFAVGAWLSRRLRSPRGGALGLFWMAWLVYAALILYFARPLSEKQISLLIALFAMMGYVTSGLLYRSRWLVGLGLTVTVLIVLGYVAWPAGFDLWMAVLGGGSLLAAGTYIYYAWR